MKLSIKAKPGAKKDSVEKIDETHYNISVRARAADGKANRAILKMLAKELGVAASSITIVAGMMRREKRVEVRQ